MCHSTSRQRSTTWELLVEGDLARVPDGPGLLRRRLRS